MKTPNGRGLHAGVIRLSTLIIAFFLLLWGYIIYGVVTGNPPEQSGGSINPSISSGGGVPGGRGETSGPIRPMGPPGLYRETSK